MRKILIYGLVLIVFTGLFAVSVYNTTGQTKYRGILRGHQVQMEVKSRTNIDAFTSVVWDTTSFLFIAKAGEDTRGAVASGSHITLDSIADTLAQRGSVFGLKLFAHFGLTKGAAIDTVIVYGDTVKNPYYDATGASNVNDADTIIWTQAQLDKDSSFYSTFYYTDIDSINYLTSLLDSIEFVAIPLYYVKLPDSASNQFAGVVVESIEADTTGSGSPGGTPSADGGSSGMIVISGVAEAKVRGDSIFAGAALITGAGGALVKAKSVSATLGFTNGGITGGDSAAWAENIRSVVAKAIFPFVLNSKDTIRVLPVMLK